MKIPISSNLPPADELVQILNDQFAPRYSFRLFGLGKEKTIMARKSGLIGVQISFADKQANFQATTPSIAGSALSFMMLTEFAALLILPLLILSEGFKKDPYKEMAKEIALFLRDKCPSQESA
jgi:hypothetical protein